MKHLLKQFIHAFFDLLGYNITIGNNKRTSLIVIDRFVLSHLQHLILFLSYILMRRANQETKPTTTFTISFVTTACTR